MGVLKWLKETASGPVAWGAIFSTYVIILLTVGYVSYLNTSERNRAIDDFCLVQEQAHLEAVTGLKNLYVYLADLPDEEAKSRLNEFIIVRLPETEKEATNDVAPEICDETYYPGLGGLFGWTEADDYGRPEPDPVIPVRPTAVDDLYDEAVERVAGRP